jgi:hypothetical protein
MAGPRGHGDSLLESGDDEPFEFSQSGDHLRAIIKASVESLKIQRLHERWDGSGDRFAQCVAVAYVRHRAKEADNHHVQYHFASEFFGEARGGNALDAAAGGKPVDVHQILLGNEDAAGLQLRCEPREGLL